MQPRPQVSSVELVGPNDKPFEGLRQVFNELYGARPAIIALPRNDDEIGQALQLAQDRSLPVAVRGGGHSLAGRSTVEGGLVIDLRRLDQIEDNGDGTFWIGGGTKAGQVVKALDKKDLALPLGDSPDVGIGGLTLGGGIGWLTRRFGLTLDHLEGMNVVTADGSITNASPDDNTDLFWALRGSGGGYGVISRFLFRPVPLGSVLAGAMAFRYSRETLTALLAALANAPDALGTIVLAMRAPPFPYIPKSAVGSPVLAMTFVWAGEIEAGHRAIDQIGALGEQLDKDVRVRRYAEMYDFAAGAPEHVTDTTETLFTDELDPQSLSAIDDAVNEPAVPDTLSVVEIRPLGGALASREWKEVAFAHRGRKLLVSVVRAGFPLADYETHRAFVQRIASAFAKVKKGAYVNFTQSRDADPALAFPKATRDQLLHVREKYDKNGVFQVAF